MLLWVAVMQHTRGPGPAGALHCPSRIGHILLITDAAGCLGCFNSVCPLSCRLPFFLIVSESPILSVSSPLHPSASPKCSTSHLPPSATLLCTPFCHHPSNCLFVYRSSSSHQTSFSPPSTPVSLSVLGRHSKTRHRLVYAEVMKEKQ